MNEIRKTYLDNLYRSYHTADAGEADRLNRWRSIEPESAQLLWMLVRAKQAKTLLEIGTSGGYSTLWLADAAEQIGGHLTTLEIDPARHRTASAHIAAVGLDNTVTALCTDAMAFLQDNQNRYGFILLDAERPAYCGYWLHLKRALADSGSLLVVDNVLSHAEQVKDFIALVQADDSVESTTVQIGAGLFVVVKK